MALLIVLVVMLLVSAIVLCAGALVRVDLLVASRLEASTAALYAAESGVALTMSELRRMPDWGPAVSGLRQSPLSSGAFEGSRRLPGGGAVTLCCEGGSVSARLASETGAALRPARRAVTWRPFLWLPFDTIARDTPPSPTYLVVFIANDEEEAAAGAAADANGKVLVRAEAVDASGLRRTIEALVARWPGPGGAEEEGAGAAPVVGILSWREVR